MERDGEVAEYDFCKRYFNSHAHVERDSLRNTARKGVQDFNSHAHVERDQSDALYTQMVGNFNSHAHVERDV